MWSSLPGRSSERLSFRTSISPNFNRTWQPPTYLSQEVVTIETVLPALRGLNDRSLIMPTQGFGLRVKEPHIETSPCRADIELWMLMSRPSNWTINGPKGVVFDSAKTLKSA